MMNQESFVQTALELGAVRAELRGTHFGIATFERRKDTSAFVEICNAEWAIDKAVQMEHKAIIKFWKFKTSD